MIIKSYLFRLIIKLNRFDEFIHKIYFVIFYLDLFLSLYFLFNILYPILLLFSNIKFMIEDQFTLTVFKLKII